MCEIFGISSSTPLDVRGYLKTFYSHSINHPHGWGILRKNNGKPEIIKEPICATGSRKISRVINETEPQTDILAHIRLATVGAVKYNNCHPYTGKDISGRNWTLIHNGTIYSSRLLSKYLSLQKGDTDSERVFLYLLDTINDYTEKNKMPLSAKQRCDIINEIAITLSPRNKLNFMIFDGEILYVHKNMMDTLSYLELNNGIIISTQPLDNNDWKQFPMTKMLAYKKGKCVYEGTNHGNVFTPTLEYITAFDAMNI